MFKSRNKAIQLKARLQTTLITNHKLEVTIEQYKLSSTDTVGITILTILNSTDKHNKILEFKS